MADIVSGRGRGSTGGGGLQKPQSNGLLVHLRGRLYTTMLRYAWPVFVEAADGISGEPVIQVRTSLGEARDLDLSTTGDKAIRFEAYMFVLTRLRMALANGAPDGVSAELWTGPNATGTMIGTITAGDFAGLTDRLVVVTKTFPDVPRLFDWLYVRVITPNAGPLTVSFWGFGDVLIANDTRGLPR